MFAEQGWYASCKSGTSVSVPQCKVASGWLPAAICMQSCISSFHSRGPSGVTEWRLLVALCPLYAQMRLGWSLPHLCVHTSSCLSKGSTDTNTGARYRGQQARMRKIDTEWVGERYRVWSLVKRLGLTFTQLLISWHAMNTAARFLDNSCFDDDSNGDSFLLELKVILKMPQFESNCYNLLAPWKQGVSLSDTWWEWRWPYFCVDCTYKQASSTSCAVQ